MATLVRKAKCPPTFESMGVARPRQCRFKRSELRSISNIPVSNVLKSCQNHVHIRVVGSTPDYSAQQAEVLRASSIFKRWLGIPRRHLWTKSFKKGCRSGLSKCTVKMCAHAWNPSKKNKGLSSANRLCFFSNLGPKWWILARHLIDLNCAALATLACKVLRSEGVTKPLSSAQMRSQSSQLLR